MIHHRVFLPMRLATFFFFFKKKLSPSSMHRNAHFVSFQYVGCKLLYLHPSAFIVLKFSTAILAPNEMWKEFGSGNRDPLDIFSTHSVWWDNRATECWDNKVPRLFQYKNMQARRSSHIIRDDEHGTCVYNVNRMQQQIQLKFYF